MTRCIQPSPTAVCYSKTAFPNTGEFHGAGQMPGPGRIFRALPPIVLVLSLGACVSSVDPQIPEEDTSPCHIIYDAGSKSTRLYVYQLTETGWLKHVGPKKGALADPVRSIRGKTIADADAVVSDIVNALEDMRHEGPLKKNGVAKWPAFDWHEQCEVETVSVLATAGMRLAEQHDALASESLWKLLNNRLSNTVGMKATTRTLSAYEEGLFAWLAMRESQADDAYGVAEMGGASIQVAFPCPQCESTRQVKVKGRNVPVFSYSFLGWGQDEAWKKFGSLSACDHGAGKSTPDWKMEDCAIGMASFDTAAMDVEKNISKSNNLRWYLSDAFRYMKTDDVERFCRQGVDNGFEPKTSCFRAVYLRSVLDMLGLPSNSVPSDVDWTLGAVICTATQCLESQSNK
jgi:hypothetical protein